MGALPALSKRMIFVHPMPFREWLIVFIHTSAPFVHTFCRNTQQVHLMLQIPSGFILVTCNKVSVAEPLVKPYQASQTVFRHNGMQQMVRGATVSCRIPLHGKSMMIESASCSRFLNHANLRLSALVCRFSTSRES